MPILEEAGITSYFEDDLIAGGRRRYAAANVGCRGNLRVPDGGQRGSCG